VPRTVSPRAAHCFDLDSNHAAALVFYDDVDFIHILVAAMEEFKTLLAASREVTDF
jgi:hypothetical protein